MSYGLIIPPIETPEEGANHVLGSSQLSEPVINPSGDWLPHLPDREPQSKNGVETQACTVYGTLSAIETLIFFKTGIKVNYSDRYVANVARNRGILNPYGGADPHKIAELIRTITGNLAEDRAPWTPSIKTVEDYYALDIAQLIEDGPAWYKEWKLNHLWVFQGGPAQDKREKLKDALTKGTVCVSVAAWFQQNGLYIKPAGVTDNHWTLLARVKDGEPDKDFDSYDTYIKDLDPLYDFAIAKVYFLTPVPHVFLKNLYFQMTDSEVPYLQKALVKLGYPIPRAVTTFFGSETKTALARFQADNQIDDNGEHFGPRTRLALNRALQPPLGVFELLVLTIRTYAGW